MPPAQHPRLDLGSRRVLWPSGGAEGRTPGGLPEPPAQADLAYCPLAPAGAKGTTRQLAAIAAAGCPTLVHTGPGDPVDPLPAGSIVVWDLLAPSLEGDPGLTRLDPDRPSGAALWIAVPLLPGLALDPEALTRLLESLVRFAPEAVVAVTPELSPADRRRLSERFGEDRYEEVFHGRAISERTFAAAARRAGLEWRPPRPPLPEQPLRLARNREVAAVLAEAGELWLRLGRAEPEGFALTAAARHADAVTLDVMALAREGNLEVLDWLSPVARAAVVELSDGGRSSLLEELVASWPEPPEGSSR